MPCETSGTGGRGAWFEVQHYAAYLLNVLGVARNHLNADRFSHVISQSSHSCYPAVPNNEAQ
jgi:hypothetical protein